jgi:hypothetical protein
MAVSKSVKDVLLPLVAFVPVVFQFIPFAPPVPTTIVFAPDKEIPELYTRPPAPPPPPLAPPPPPPPATINTSAVIVSEGDHEYPVCPVVLVSTEFSVPQVYVPVAVSEYTKPAVAAAVIEEYALE